jgi:predicted PurR-regulated permease PerM
VRTTPQHGVPQEKESPAPLGGATASAWSIDPKRRRRYSQIAFGLAALVVAIVVLYLLRDFLGAFVLGSAIAFLIQPAVMRLHALGVPRIVAIAVVFVGILIALAGLVLLIVPLGVSEVGQLQVQAPALAVTAQDRLNSLQPIAVFGIGIVAFLLAIEAPAVRRDLRRFVPSDYRSDFDQIWRQVRKMLYAYVRGQLIIAGLIGITSGVVCALLRLPDAVALGVIAGVTAFIPYLGPFIGAVPAILVGLAQSPGQALLVLVAYIAIPNFYLNFIYPKVMGDAVRLPPILVIIALIAGFSWGGILGMFVAVPIAATLRILFDHIYPRLYERPA